MCSAVSRRQVLLASGACLGAGALMAAPAVTPQPLPATPAEPFRYCLNLGTLLGYKLSLAKEVELAAKVGFRSIEPWFMTIQRYVDEGHSLSDLRRRIEDLGLTVENAIGFATWIVDDEAQRQKGLEQLRREMDMVAQLGGRRIAAAPAGAQKTPDMDLRRVAQRYRAVLELGRKMGIVAQLEIWGGSKVLHSISEAAFVAIEAADPDACLLLDLFHIYKGGSNPSSIRLLNGGALHVFHINDYPAQPPREKVVDGDRVFPGDGVAPVASVLRDLYAIGFRGALSLELFNRQYWKEDSLVIAQRGFDKVRSAVRNAFGQSRG